MNWTDKIDQQRNALLSIFYMFTFMALLVIRNGLDVRGAPASCTYAPFDTSLDNDHLSPSQCDRLDQLYAEAQALLCTAELVARRLAGLGCEIYELMKLADVLARSLRGEKSFGSADGLPHNSSRQASPSPRSRAPP